MNYFQNTDVAIKRTYPHSLYALKRLKLARHAHARGGEAGGEGCFIKYKYYYISNA
jgi:hypothetical protein